MPREHLVRPSRLLAAGAFLALLAPQPAAPLAFSLGLDGRSAAADREPGVVVPNTGGLVLAATPGVHWNVLPDAWLFARAQLPFHRALLGEQSVGPVFTAGVRYQAL